MLYWLPLPQGILFKVSLMAFDCFRGQGPVYFDDVLVPFHAVGACARLRSADHGDVVIRARVLCISVSTASIYLHHLCGTTFRLN